MNKLKNSLQNGNVSIGTWIQIPSSAVVEIIAHNSGDKLDWMCIDMEHGSIGIESMTDLIRTIEANHITPFVRIPKNDYIWIHRVLDAGAKGLIIPMINSFTDARKSVSEALYPPTGKRSFGYSRANCYGKDFVNSVHCANDEISIILQIEHSHGIIDLNRILDTDGIDGTFIGPYDLSGSMGIVGDFNNEKYKNVLSEYKSKSKDHSVPTGIHVVRPTEDKVKKAAADGYRIIAVGTDAVFLEEKCNSVFKNL